MAYKANIGSILINAESNATFGLPVRYEFGIPTFSYTRCNEAIVRSRVVPDAILNADLATLHTWRAIPDTYGVFAQDFAATARRLMQLLELEAFSGSGPVGSLIHPLESMPLIASSQMFATRWLHCQHCM